MIIVTCTVKCVPCYVNCSQNELAIFVLLCVGCSCHAMHTTSRVVVTLLLKRPTHLHARNFASLCWTLFINYLAWLFTVLSLLCRVTLSSHYMLHVTLNTCHARWFSVLTFGCSLYSLLQSLHLKKLWVTFFVTLSIVPCTEYSSLQSISYFVLPV